MHWNFEILPWSNSSNGEGSLNRKYKMYKENSWSWSETDKYTGK